MILRLHLEQLVVPDSKEKVPQLEVSVEHEGSWAMIMLIKYPCMTLSRKLKLSLKIPTRNKHSSLVWVGRGGGFKCICTY